MNIEWQRAGYLAGGVLALLAAGCSREKGPTYPGYVEGEFVYISAPVDGRLQHLYVQRGQQVAANAELYELEGKEQQTQRNEAAERLASARAQVENLKGGRRPDERTMTKAQVEQARAASEFAKAQLTRDEQLFAKGLIPIMRLEQSRTEATARAAQLVEASAQLRLSSESIGRHAEVTAAVGDAGAAAAAFDRADWQLSQRLGFAPNAALVQDTYYSPGEWVPATRPIVSLLPPENIRLRFYMPETALSALKLGAVMNVGCDGCPADLTATVSYISTEPEYTPPVLFSKENRARLVYRVDAKPAAAALKWLKPGLPIDLHAEPAT